jgi:hypothetical protein
VKARLAAFEREHRAYDGAEGKVEAADAQLHAAQSRVHQRDAEQNEALQALATALVPDGQPRANPFAAFGASPAAITRLPVTDKLKAMHTLVAAVQRHKGLSKSTLQAAQATEQALVPIDKLAASVRDARHTRDAIGQNWKAALATLKRATRAAADDGAPHLYATLFDRPARSNGKAAKSAPTPTPVPVASPAPSASPAPNAAA